MIDYIFIRNKVNLNKIFYCLKIKNWVFEDILNFQSFNLKMFSGLPTYPECVFIFFHVRWFFI